MSETHSGLLEPARTPHAAIGRRWTAPGMALRQEALRERLMAEGRFASGEEP